MNEEQDNYVTITDEQGNEVLYEVMMTFHSDEYNKDYILFTEPGVEENDPDEEAEILAFSFDPEKEPENEEGELIPIEDDKEWDMIAEVLNTFVADDDSNDDNEK
jgi:uncharacterized protein YrzB (UPF0473 family)